MAVYEHIGTVTQKVHIHLVCEGMETHKKQLRNIGQATGLDLKGNGKCSFKEYDGNQTAMVYMTKGEFEPKFIKGYTAEDATRWKQQWVTKVEQSNDERHYNSLFDDGEDDQIDYELYTREHPRDPTDIYHKFGWVRYKARNYVMTANRRIWNMRAMNIYRMLVYSYCMRHNVIMTADYMKKL